MGDLLPSAGLFMIKVSGGPGAVVVL